MDTKEIERKWQKKWEETKVFEADRKTGKKKIFMAIPYPYCSGPLHIGHGRTYTIADVWIRYKRMQGFNALWPMAFHITGTPILAVSKKIKEGDKKTIKLYKEYVGLYKTGRGASKEIEKIVKEFTDPWNVANFFSNVISHDFKSLGFSIDWRRSFTTGDKDYNQFISWQFKTLRKKGLIKKGKHPVQYCLKCKNAVGEDDIKDGDVLDTSIQTFTAIKFPFKDGFLIACTLRPETIFGVTNLWVNPEREYVKAKVGKEIWYVSETGAEKLKYQAHDIVVLKKFKGKKIVGKEAKSPVDKKSLLVLPAEFVEDDACTGVVYSVPAHAPDDYMGLADLKNDPKYCKKFGLDHEKIKKLEPISIIKIDGFGEFPAEEICKKMGIKSEKERKKLEEATKKIYKEEFYNGVLKENTGKFSGMKISEIKDKVKNWMKKQGNAFDFFESTTKDLRCRDGGKVVIKVIEDQWFIDYGNEEWKKKARKCLKKMKIIPEHYRKTFEHAIEWLHERACARRRGLGTKLPWDDKWIIESLSDSTIYPVFYTLVHKIRKNGIKPEQLTPEFFDYVLLGKGRLEHVEKKTGIKKKLIEEMKKDFEYWYPVDERHTAIPHITNHLTFYIFNHAAIFPEKFWPKAITLNELLIREGAKMSKSKGNVIPLVEVSEKYSSDLYRLYMTSAADIDTTIDWTEKNVDMMKKKLGRFKNILFDIVKNKSKQGQMKNIDLWLISKFNQLLKKSEGMIDEFKIRDYSQLMFFEMLNNFNYYLKRCEKPNYSVLREIGNSWLKCLSPVIPHICEEFWSLLGNKGFVSVAEWPRVNEKQINEKIEEMEDYVKDVLSDINEIVKILKKKPKHIHIYISPLWKYEVYNTILRGFGKENIVKEIMRNPEIRKQGNKAVHFAQTLQKEAGELKKIPSADDEYKILNEAKIFIEKETGAKVDIWMNEDMNKYDPQKKSEKAEPMKPAIYLE
jgi:leucyl-tRNA synthetase